MSRALAWAYAAVVIAATLSAPAVARAATVIAWSSKKPAPNAVSSTSRPTVSVYVVSKYAVVGSARYRLYVDGVRRTPKIVYSRRSTRFTLSYRVVTPLKQGRHTVQFRVRNSRGTWYSVTWKFSVATQPSGPPPVTVKPMPITIRSVDCGSCHIGYPAAHPMTDCAGCHGPNRPVAGAVYTNSAHTVACATQPCHRPGVTSSFPHVLSEDCASCHNATYANIPPAGHPVDVEAAHISTSTVCTAAGCHLSSLTLEHYLRSIGGVNLSCATCHGSSDPDVLAAIGARSTRCESCHTLTPLHPTLAAPHTVGASASCLTGGCHSGTLITLHSAAGGPGCAACHSPGRVPSADCATCHRDTRAAHSGAAAKHLAADTCVSALCHPADVSAIHGAAGGPGCGACHAAGRTPSVACAGCHAGTFAQLHPRSQTAHASASNGCVSLACHGSDVSAIHAAPGGPGCAACHAPGVTPGIGCSTCHTGDLSPRHATLIGARHTASDALCITSACHVADVALIHAPGLGCADCHGPGKIASLSCASCHPATVALAHPKATASHTAPAGVCVAAGCHVANATALHAALPSQGCPTCHVAGRKASLDCASCHTTGLVERHGSAAASHTAALGTCVQAACHGADIAGLHRALATSGCPTCHGPGKVPTATCTTCHTGDLTARHPSATAAHTAPAGACVQGGCHGSNASTVHGRVGGPGCAACHAPGKTPSLTCESCHNAAVLHSGAAASHAAPTGTCVQAACHATDVVSVHGRVGGPGCAACHAVGRTAVLSCETCHTGDLTARHATAAGVAHDAPRGPCISSRCHVSNVATIHATGRGCVDCHGIGRTPSLVCGTCHTASVLSLHPSAGTAHTAPATVCSQSSCHGTDVTAIHVVAGVQKCFACHADGTVPGVVCSASGCHPGGLMAHSVPAAPHMAPAGGCVAATCHSADVAAIHVVAGVKKCAACHAIGTTPTLTCSACHVGTFATLHPRYAAVHATASTCAQGGCHLSDVTAIHVVNGVSKCVACHATGVTPSTACAACHAGDITSVHAAAIGTKHTVTTYGCVASKCHPSNDAGAIHAAPSGPGCAACHAAGVTPSTACVTCHAAGVVASHTDTMAVAGHAVNQHPCTSAACHGGNAATTHAQSASSCFACHTNADGTADSNACYGAYGCHDLAWATRHANYAITTDFHGGGIGTGDSDWGWWSNGGIKPPYSRGQNLPCSTCHDPKGTSNVYDFPLVINGTAIRVTDRHTQLQTVCIACHTGTVNDWHAGCISCHTGGMGAGAIADFTGQDCSRCHQHGMISWPHSIWSFSGPTL